MLSRYLFRFRKNSGVFTHIKSNIACVRVNSVNLSSNKFLIFRLKFFNHLSSFSLTDTLTDNMLSCLSNNSAEILCFKRNIDCAADFSALSDKLSLFESEVCVLILNFVNNIFSYINLNFLLFRVDIAMNDILSVIVVLSGYNNCC